MQGIDVSNYQGNINWEKVKASGKEFVIIRAGWGKTNTDPKFKEYIENAIKYGFHIGIYYFLYAKTESDIAKNALKCNEIIQPYKDKIDMKVWADWEYDSDNYCKGLNKETRTKWVKTFCKELKDMGYDTGIYANPDYISNKFGDISEYPLWLAYYTNNENVAKKYNPLIWQYSSKGKVDGIKGNVDLDIFYGESKTIIAPVTQPKEEVKNVTAEYTVKSGDTLGAIASRYRTTVDKIKAINPQITNINIIKVGQVILIPTTITIPINDTNPYKEPIAIQKFGSKGEGVKWVQWALNKKGGYNLLIDGAFGTNTENAVIDFQMKNGLTKDGKVGVQTRKKLK